MSEVPSSPREWFLDHQGAFRELTARLSGSDDELRLAFKCLSGTKKRTEDGLAAATQIADTCIDMLVMSQYQESTYQRFKDPRFPVHRQLNLSQGDVVKRVELNLNMELFKFTKNGFTQSELRNYWDTETLLHDDLIRYIFRPRVYLRAVEDWAATAASKDWPEDLKLINRLFDVTLDFFHRLVQDPLRLLGLQIAASLPTDVVVRQCLEHAREGEQFLWLQAFLAVCKGTALGDMYEDDQATLSGGLMFLSNALVTFINGAIVQWRSENDVKSAHGRLRNGVLLQLTGFETMSTMGYLDIWKGEE